MRTVRLFTFLFLSFFSLGVAAQNTIYMVNGNSISTTTPGGGISGPNAPMLVEDFSLAFYESQVGPLMMVNPGPGESVEYELLGGSVSSISGIQGGGFLRTIAVISASIEQRIIEDATGDVLQSNTYELQDAAVFADINSGGIVNPVFRYEEDQENFIRANAPFEAISNAFLASKGQRTFNIQNQQTGGIGNGDATTFETNLTVEKDAEEEWIDLNGDGIRDANEIRYIYNLVSISNSLGISTTPVRGFARAGMEFSILSKGELYMIDRGSGEIYHVRFGADGGLAKASSVRARVQGDIASRSGAFTNVPTVWSDGPASLEKFIDGDNFTAFRLPLNKDARVTLRFFGGASPADLCLSFAGVENGTIEYSGRGTSFVYRPNRDFSGNENFDITVTFCETGEFVQEVEVDITIPAPLVNQQASTICIESTLDFCGRTYNKDSVGRREHVQYLPDFQSNWCILDLDTFPRNRYYPDESICYGQSFTYPPTGDVFRARLIHTNNVLESHFRTTIDQNGCQEDHFIDITFLRPDLAGTTSGVVDQGEDFCFDYLGQEYCVTGQETGTYPVEVDDDVSAAGCVRVYVVNLTVIPPDAQVEDIVLCQGDVYTLEDGRQITSDEQIDLGNGEFQNVRFIIPEERRETFLLNPEDPKVLYNGVYTIRFNDGCTQDCEYVIPHPEHGCDSIIVIYDLVEEGSSEIRHLCVTQAELDAGYHYLGQTFRETGAQDVFEHDGDSIRAYVYVDNGRSRSTPDYVELTSDACGLTVGNEGTEDLLSDLIEFPHPRIFNGVSYRHRTRVPFEHSVIVPFNARFTCSTDRQYVFVSFTGNSTSVDDEIITRQKCSDTLMFEGQPYTEARDYILDANHRCHPDNSRRNTAAQDERFTDDGINTFYDIDCPCRRILRVVEADASSLPTQTLRRRLCEGESFVFMDSVISQTGTYSFREQGSGGACDRIVLLIVEEQPSEITVNYDTVFVGEVDDCFGLFDDENEEDIGRSAQSRVLEEMVTSINRSSSSIQTTPGLSCVVTIDSIIQISRQSSCTEETIYLCDGDSYTYLGVPLEGFGEHVFGITNNTGTEDQYKITLADGRSSATGFIQDTVCPGELYLNGPFRINVTGIENALLTYHETIPNARGCDSVITLELFVRTESDRDFVFICEGQTYLWYGQEYSETGTYEVFINDGSVCGRKKELLLTVIDVDEVLTLWDTAQLCFYRGDDFQGVRDTIFWNNMAITAPGDYFTDFVPNPLTRVCRREALHVLPRMSSDEVFVNIDLCIHGEDTVYRGRRLTPSSRRVTLYDSVSRYGCTVPLNVLVTRFDPERLDYDGDSRCIDETHELYEDMDYGELRVVLKSEPQRMNCELVQEFELIFKPVDILIEKELCAGEHYEFVTEDRILELAAPLDTTIEYTPNNFYGRRVIDDNFMIEREFVQPCPDRTRILLKEKEDCDCETYQAEFAICSGAISYHWIVNDILIQNESSDILEICDSCINGCKMDSIDSVVLIGYSADGTVLCRHKMK